MARCRWIVRCASIVVLGISAGCAVIDSAAPIDTVSHALTEVVTLPEGWSVQQLPGATLGRHISLLQRSSLVTPVRFRVIVIPGSGCTGFASFAERYFAGLLHAQVQVLHKPGVDVQAGPVPERCPVGFVEADSLESWRDDAIAALKLLEHGDNHRPNDDGNNQRVPILLVGISEGGELLPSLAAAIPNVDGVVLLSSSGLDPREAGALQAARLGEQRAWHRLTKAVDSSLPDTTITEGRTLRYWRTFMRWPLAQPLIDAPLPLLQVWGDADELVPPVAYQRFTERARMRNAPFCSWRMPGASHSLQTLDAADGLQKVWARVEAWARLRSAVSQPKPGVKLGVAQGDLSLCSPIGGSPAKSQQLSSIELNVRQRDTRFA